MIESAEATAQEGQQRGAAGSLLAMAGLCLYTFTFVTTRFPLGEAGVALAAIGVVLQGSRLRIPGSLWVFGALIAWSFIGSFFATMPEMVRGIVLDQVKLLCVMIIIANTLRTEKQIRFFLLFYLACFMAYPARGTLINYTLGHTVFGRAVGNAFYANPNELATQAIFALAVALGIAFSATRQHLVRALGIASALVLLVVILLTQSRGAVIGLAVAIAPALLMLAARRPVGAILGALVVGAVLSLAIPASVWERLSGISKLSSTETIAEADIEGSAAERYRIYQTALRIAKDYPFLGVGLGLYNETNALYAPDLGRKDTHNTYLNLAAEVGFPGLVLWSALILRLLYGAYRARRRAPGTPLATLQSWVERALWAYLVAALFGTYSRINVLYVMLAVLWCCAEILRASPPAESSTRGTSRPPLA